MRRRPNGSSRRATRPGRRDAPSLHRDFGRGRTAARHRARRRHRAARLLLSRTIVVSRTARVPHPHARGRDHVAPGHPSGPLGVTRGLGGRTQKVPLRFHVPSQHLAHSAEQRFGRAARCPAPAMFDRTRARRHPRARKLVAQRQDRLVQLRLRPARGCDGRRFAGGDARLHRGDRGVLLIPFRFACQFAFRLLIIELGNMRQNPARAQSELAGANMKHFPDLGAGGVRFFDDRDEGERIHFCDPNHRANSAAVSA